MSGSPVFIDGKLLGAVAYSFPFTKEAIGGITPITQMVDAFDESLDPSSGKVILKNSRLWKYRLPSPAIKRGGKSGRDFGRHQQQPLLAVFEGIRLFLLRHL